MRRRLDHLLVERGLAATRSRARDMITRGHVNVAGMRANKAGLLIENHAEIAVCGLSSSEYVSRGALKLIAALDAFKLDPDGRTILDVGASTGGFTEVLLRRGARKVYAVDVGHGQLHGTLDGDDRICRLDGVDARRLSPEVIPEPVDAVVADVSFISLLKVLPAPLALTASGAWLVALIKPQFEVGPELVSKRGIVRDEAAREAAVQKIAGWLRNLPGWHLIGVIASPIRGGAGNIEYLAGAIRDG